MSVPIGKIVGPVNGSRCTLGIRPEHVRLNTGGNVDTTCRVAFTEQLGGETYLYYDVEGLPQITIHQPRQLPVDEGQSLELSFERENLHVFDADGLALVNGLGE